MTSRLPKLLGFHDKSLQKKNHNAYSSINSKYKTLILFFFMKLIFLLSCLASATAGPLDSCSSQSACLEYNITEVTDDCGGPACAYKVCWIEKKGGDCKASTETISHWANKYSDASPFCPNQDGGWGKCQTSAQVVQCQSVAPGGTASLLLKDGNVCRDSFQMGDATCKNSTTASGSCGGNAPGMECIWELTVPDTCSSPPVSDPDEPPVSEPDEPVVQEDDPPPGPSGSNGDPHFKTWKKEHFEYHGQCDLVLAKDESFASDIGLEVQIRTKVVRFWSYIKNAAIRIGEDILEVEGGAETEATNHYWYNLAYQEKIETLGGFPVTYHQPVAYKRRFEVDLSSKFPGQKIIISTYKEFVRVDFENGTEEAFGNTKGLLGDFNSGDTLARDGSTVLNDFWEYGNEWQVLPFENMLFHETSEPQFPQKCIQPEDPRGDRRRKLAESTVSEAQAEAACAHLKDPLDRKDCLYDILATQDLDMVGAY